MCNKGGDGERGGEDGSTFTLGRGKGRKGPPITVILYVRWATGDVRSLDY